MTSFMSLNKLRFRCLKTMQKTQSVGQRDTKEDVGEAIAWQWLGRRGATTAAVQALSFSREHCWFRFGSQGMVPGSLFTGDEPLIWVCVPLMGLPDHLRTLSSLVNVEQAHWGGGHRNHCQAALGREGGETGRTQVMQWTEVYGGDTAILCSIHVLWTSSYCLSLFWGKYIYFAL